MKNNSHSPKEIKKCNYDLIEVTLKKKNRSISPKKSKLTIEPIIN